MRVLQALVVTVILLVAELTYGQVPRVQYNGGAPQVAPLVNFIGEAGTCGPSANGPVCSVNLGGGGTFNVKAYGAVGNGTATDTTALQAASDACKNAGGGTIYAPRGTYKAARWTVGSNCILRGDGIDATIFKCTDTEPNQCILIGDSTSTSASDVSMTWFTLDARGVTRIGAALGGYVRGIGTVVGSSDVTISAVKVLDGGRRAIEIIGTDHAAVIGSTIIDADGDGIHFDGVGAGTCTDVKAVGNTVRSSGDVGIAADYCDGVNFTGNTVAGKAAVGGTGARTENGLDISGSSNVVVASNVVRKVRNACLLASGFRQTTGGVATDLAVKHAVIDGNTCSQLTNLVTGTCSGGTNNGAQCGVASECPGGGVCAPTNHAINVLGCTTGQSTAPCNANTYATDITITNNHLYDTPNIPILLATYVDGFTISGNAIRNGKWMGAGGTGDAAIQLASSGGNPITNGSVTGNLIVGDGVDLGNGVFASGAGISNVLIANNRVLGVARSADVRVTSGTTSGVLVRNQRALRADITGGGDLVSAGRGSSIDCDDCLLGSIPCAGSGNGTTARLNFADVWECAQAPTPAPTITPPFNVPLALATGALTVQHTNSVPGTIQDRLVKMTGSGTVTRAGAGDTHVAIGVCVSNCGDNGTFATANVAVVGAALCEFDASGVAIGDYVGIANDGANPGRCTSLGTTPPDNRQIIGRAKTASAGNSTATVLLMLDSARVTPTPAGTPLPVGSATSHAGTQPAFAAYDHRHQLDAAAVEPALTVTNMKSSCTDAQTLGGTAGGTGVECQTDDDTPDNAAEVPDDLDLDAETFSVAPAVTAGTNARGQGALTKDVNVVTVAASAPSGVTLPTATTGRRIVIVNKGANTVNVYPAGASDVIDGLSGGAAIALPVNRVLAFNASSTTQWYTDRGGTVPVFDYATTATAAGTTTLTAASAATQYFTGSSTQTVKLPSTATLALGSIYAIVNLSTGGAVTVQSSGSNTVVVVPAGTSAVLRSISTTVDTAAAWDAPATLFVSQGTGLGAATRKIEFSNDFTASTSNGVTTVAPGATFKMDGEAIAAGEIPQNIQPTPDLPKLYGAAGEASLGYVTSKRCFGGTNHGTTCSADSLCGGGVCLNLMTGDGVSAAVPFYFVDGIILGSDLKIQDHADEVLLRTVPWCVDGGAVDIPNLGMAPRMFNKSNNRTIEKICIRQNATGGTVNMRRDGSAGLATPFPTPAIGTPSGVATPAAWQADAGCSTGLSIDWPKDSHIAIQWTQATGVNNVCVYVSYRVKP